MPAEVEEGHKEEAAEVAHLEGLVAVEQVAETQGELLAVASVAASLQQRRDPSLSPGPQAPTQRCQARPPQVSPRIFSLVPQEQSPLARLRATSSMQHLSTRRL